MRNKLIPALAFAIVCLLPAHAQTAQEILAKSKQAMGGDALDQVRSVHTKASIKTSGLSGEAESWEDTLTGHYVERYHLGPASGADGFDGTTVWSTDTSGQPRAEGGGDARQGAADEAYRRAMAYWYPQRWPAQIEYSGEKEDQGKRFYLLRISPQNGRPFDLWIDATTHLFDRTVEKADIETRTTYLSDYRTVQGVKLPFAVHGTNGQSQYDQFGTVQQVELNVPIEAARFRMPAPPAPDFAIAGGKSSTTVPFQLLNNHIYVDVKINGKGPYTFLCDTGGANIVAPTLARELDLKSQGALQGRGVGEKSEDVGLTKVQSVQVGEATLSDQLFAIFDLDSFANVEGVKIRGLIGYEIFKRLVVRVDYEHSQLTITLPSAFSYHGQGTPVPFQFNNHIPQVEGDIDGIAGKFDIDTGSRSSLSVLKPFADKHDLAARLGAKVQAVTGWGVGGAARGLVTRVKTLRLGSVPVDNPLTELSLQTQGAFISPYVAGNVGAGVLKRFNITFDYPHQQLIFERNANYDKPDIFDRSGMWVNKAGDDFEVMDVIAAGPAAVAGLKVGDKISAVDGRAAAQVSLPELRARFRGGEAPGTKIKLTVQSGAAQTRDVVLVLKDLV